MLKKRRNGKYHFRIICIILIIVSILLSVVCYKMHPVLMRYAVSVAETIMLNSANEAIVKILEDENFSYENTPILIVTNDFHMYRSIQIAKKTGYEKVSGAPSGTYIFLFPHYMVREFCAILKNFVLGRM